MKKENYIGIELAKKLQEWGCDIGNDICWFNLANSEETEKGIKKFELMNIHDVQNLGEYPAYSYYNILVNHTKEFFGENKNKGSYQKFFSCSVIVMSLLQQGKKEEADKYIEDKCVFNPNNQ